MRTITKISLGLLGFVTSRVLQRIARIQEHRLNSIVLRDLHSASCDESSKLPFGRYCSDHSANLMGPEVMKVLAQEFLKVPSDLRSEEHCYVLVRDFDDEDCTAVIEVKNEANDPKTQAAMTTAGIVESCRAIGVVNYRVLGWVHSHTPEGDDKPSDADYEHLAPGMVGGVWRAYSNHFTWYTQDEVLLACTKYVPEMDTGKFEAQDYPTVTDDEWARVAKAMKAEQEDL